MDVKKRHLVTEETNYSSQNIDEMNTEEILTLINEEDSSVASAVKQQIPNIHKAVELIVASIKNGGRLFYVGAGTSGRLGVLDASECPPTYNTPPNLVKGLIAGGYYALVHSLEGVEDNENQAAEDLSDEELCSEDVVVGIAASGTTPYVIGALKYAGLMDASTVSISCNPDSVISSYAAVAIETVTGPEVVTGSTRMKAGTAQKMVLNMLSTTTMVKLGKVYRNYMVDLQASNEKLRRRACRILSELSSVSESVAHATLLESEWSIKEALVMLKANVSRTDSRKYLDENDGFVAKAIHSARQEVE
ncbi:N-acetylmuramic acid 6-phosphate etherase [Sediminibacillus halophilus]|uniref:N-acetylmuramic acid 6-phosphate etherase n=1 Tax=Sediminibacillus halophilus TaxID=482461 RepID=A0A1G9RFN0_9BACI|nr:N-acetylmuramic acid 6-phosphate etherase [Sediminibacillus halophilus]SDM21870.1 N-acetylmuramic acid 6-phosphate etherase [Sediminibacillus halophilus]